MSTPTCSQCGAPIQVLRELNRVEGGLVCWDCLIPNPNERWKVTVHWSADRPTVQEVGRLRSLYPDFQQGASSKAIWDSLKNESQADLGEFHKPHLDKILAANESLGFHLEVHSTLEDRADQPALERLVLAIGRNDVEQVSVLAKQVPNLDALTDGVDLLSHAIDSGSEESAHALIAAGISLANANSNYTAMQNALENGADTMIVALLDAGVDLNCRGKDEESYAIHILCRNYQSRELLARFLEQGADPRSLDDDGDTPADTIRLYREEEDDEVETNAMLALLERASQRE